MHITGEEEERRLYMGPVWDFDIAAGNKSGQPLGSNPYYIFAAVMNYWYRYLMQMPEFREATILRWNEIRDVQVADMIAHLRHISQRDQAEFERNFERHPFTGVPDRRIPPEILTIRTWMGQVEHLIKWLETRVDWLDDYFNNRLSDYDPMQRLVEYYTRERPRQLLLYDDISSAYRETRVRPISLHDRTLVSLFDAIYLFGFAMHFDGVGRTYTLTREDIAISYQRGTDFLTVNGEKLQVPAPGILEIGGTVYLPLYRIVQFLGYRVEWLESGSTLAIRPPIAPN